jgi:hypothetical protein
MKILNKSQQDKAIQLLKDTLTWFNILGTGVESTDEKIESFLIEIGELKQENLKNKDCDYDVCIDEKRSCLLCTFNNKLND